MALTWPYNVLKDAGEVPRLGRSIIEVRVGKDTKARPFTIHKELITSRSKFFANALKGSWRESKDNVVKLPEDDVDTFDLYVNLLYFGSIHIPEAGATAQREETLTEKLVRVSHQEYMALSKLYVLCDKLQDIQGVRLVTHAFVEATQKAKAPGKICFPDLWVVDYVYNNTPHGSPLRSFLMDSYAVFATNDWLRGTRSWISKDFLYDVTMSMLSLRSNPAGVDKVKYGSNYYPKTDSRRP
ncbi:hypothetical protein K491DRAFT_674661 [Lophiostoma macrostomum CBS 122681]|uniref:BTB domain-containing protein n=1 Tax=Lophiostoma macrostomum CBS 122681 TaxID=1314788 RepID=A0A6A6TLW2_9PLEO|nr:hypothetical protein K491DRAFT_674661 [Lophiostoma macrostomum CBS 122681]